MNRNLKAALMVRVIVMHPSCRRNSCNGRQALIVRLGQDLHALFGYTLFRALSGKYERQELLPILILHE